MRLSLWVLSSLQGAEEWVILQERKFAYDAIMQTVVVGLGYLAFFFIIWVFWWLRKEMRNEKEKKFGPLVSAANESKRFLTFFIQKNFLIQPCFNCHEFKMRLLDISPNSRSIQYQCVHCGKKMRAAGGTPDATNLSNVLADTWRAFEASKQPKFPLTSLEFEAVPAPMPYEQTTRTPIPEAVRAEVWRRDQGRCVNCGSKENLQFDHIIPIAQGGATSVKNLQILCQSCNLSKSTKI